jgi:flagellar biosynthesis component FlhA
LSITDVFPTGVAVDQDVAQYRFQPLQEGAIHTIKSYTNLMIMAAVGGFWFIVFFIAFGLLFCVSWETTYVTHREKMTSPTKYVEESEDEEEISPAPKGVV